MEEVDGIIVHSLRTIGCDIEEGVCSLSQFTTELIVEAVARCIHVINHEIDAPHKLPPSMSARFRIGSSLANAVKEIGYRGEVGYQTFLYSNESDIRKVFIFLLEKMPKEQSHSTEEIIGASELLMRAVSNEVGKRLSSPWVPSYCIKSGICWRGKPPVWYRVGSGSINNFNANPLAVAKDMQDFNHTVSKERVKYYSKYLKYVHNQASDQLPSALFEHNAKKFCTQQEWESEWNQFGLSSRITLEEYKQKKKEKLSKKISKYITEGIRSSDMKIHKGLDEVVNTTTDTSKIKGSRFTQIEKLQYGQDEDNLEFKGQEVNRKDTEEELQQKREEELAALKTDLQTVTTKIEDLQLGIKKYNAGQLQMDEELNRFEKENESKKESFKVKKKTMDLLPEADKNIEKLQSLVDSSAQRLVKLAHQWETHRAPLINQYRELKALTENRETDAQKKLEEIKKLRERMKEVASDAKAKEDLYTQLVAEHERMGKDVNRVAYTKRILEIVGNIKKQKQDIDKVLIDTKSIQKEINQLSGKLDRTFTVTDELVFRDAKKDDSVRKAYKFLAALHENCNSVINTVEETGVILREIRDLEDQIEQESSNKVKDTLDKITADYQQMKKENSVLLAKYKNQGTA